MFGIVDFYANLARLAGVEGDLPSDRDIDSIDQTDLFLGKSEKSKR